MNQREPEDFASRPPSPTLSHTSGLGSGVAAGVGLVFEGARMLMRESNLWALASVPVAFCTLALTIAGSLVYVNAAALYEVLTSWLPVFEVTSWYQWLWLGPLKAIVSAAGIALFAAASGLCLLAALLVANLASAPFLDRLAQRVEQNLLGHAVDTSESGFAAIAAEASRTMSNEFQRLLFFVAGWGLISLGGVLIPGAQVIAPALLVVFTAAFLPLDYAGYHLDRRQISFRVRRQWLRDHLPTMLGFGGTAMATALIPGLNLLLLPALVVAGTLLAIRNPIDD